jgi:hypothetical protein
MYSRKKMAMTTARSRVTSARTAPRRPRPLAHLGNEANPRRGYETIQRQLLVKPERRIPR